MATQRKTVALAKDFDGDYDVVVRIPRNFDPARYVINEAVYKHHFPRQLRRNGNLWIMWRDLLCWSYPVVALEEWSERKDVDGNEHGAGPAIVVDPVRRRRKRLQIGHTVADPFDYVNGWRGTGFTYLLADHSSFVRGI